MGKIQTLTKEQALILDLVRQNEYLRKNFYFTGGTALSVYHLHHRLSEDVDLFTDRDFSHTEIISFMQFVKQKTGFSFTLRTPQGRKIMIFHTSATRGKLLKIDFNHYPFKRLEPGLKVNGLNVDSLRDIASNKLLTINQRTDVKDFIDLYYLLNRYTLWDLIYSVEAKFGMKLEPMMIAADFLKVDTFRSLPIMLKALTLSKLKNFFRKKAVKIGHKITK